MSCYKYTNIFFISTFFDIFSTNILFFSTFLTFLSLWDTDNFKKPIQAEISPSLEPTFGH